MLPTHALWGMVLALPVAIAAPEFGGIALLAGFLGGVLPDMDMYVGHRRTLHYPVYYSALTVVAMVVVVAWPTGMTIGIAVLLLGAAVHSVADVFGGGLELRPWTESSDRAVYDHHRDHWIPPKRWIRYDGSPEDLSLTAAFAIPLVASLEGPFVWLVASVLIVGVGYTAIRRHLPTLAEVVVSEVLVGLPPTILAYVPDRYVTVHLHRIPADGVDTPVE